MYGTVLQLVGYNCLAAFNVETSILGSRMVVCCVLDLEVHVCLRL